MKCPVCNGNDGDLPCAYTTERPAGCLRARRLTDEEIIRAWNGPTNQSNKRRILAFAHTLEEMLTKEK